MRRPHVFERSAPRVGRQAYTEPQQRASAARLIAAQLGNLIDKADRAGLKAVVDHLEAARLEAEKAAGA